MVSLYGVIAFLIVGLVIGAFARFLIPGHEPGGWIAALCFGVLGSFLGGYTGHSFGMYHVERAPMAGLFSVIFALALVLSYEAFRRKRVVQ